MRLTKFFFNILSAHIEAKVNLYAQFKPSSLTIQQLVDFGRKADRVASYSFLRQELLVRFAHSLKELDLIPNTLLKMPSIKMVKEWYEQSFVDILTHRELEISDRHIGEFTDLLKQVLRRNQNVVQMMAEGILELKDTCGVNLIVENGIQYFLDRFYINRISVRMLINQHVLIFGSELPLSPQFIGSIDPACDVVSVVQDAFENAKNLCLKYYKTSPDVVFHPKNVVDDSSKITVVYVPSHLYHICFELFKNAMRATIEHCSKDKPLPKIKAIIVKGKEDLSIKITDVGGGIPRSVSDVLFNYMFTTAPPPAKDPTRPPFAGYGYGLPLSRLYARYFKGDLFVTSIEGYGTDACVYLKALAVDASELLPIYSTSCRRMYENRPTTGDWSQSPSGSSVPRRDYWK